MGCAYGWLPGIHWAKDYVCQKFAVERPDVGTRRTSVTCPFCKRELLLLVPSYEVALRKRVIYGILAGVLIIGIVLLIAHDFRASGLDRNQVMGKPHRNEQYQTDGTTYSIAFYRTVHTADGIKTDDEFTPIVMADEKVIGWGRNFYDKTLKIKQEIDIKLGDIQQAPLYFAVKSGAFVAICSKRS
jgi:hypothetical protein